MEKITVNIEGMHCEICESFINTKIRDRFNPKKVKSSYKRNETIIITEKPIPDSELLHLINGTGYNVLNISKEPYKKRGFLSFT